MEFICPKCKSPLDMPTKTSEMIDGTVTSSCGETYKIIGGIPRFVSDDHYAKGFGFQWNEHPKTQLDSHIGKTISRDRFYTTTEWSDSLEGQTVLEAGGGAGRFTEVIAQTGARVFSFDLSLAVEANKSNNQHYENLTFFQGDIFKIPLPEASFDRVYCLGVLQHTPDPKAAFMSLVKMLKPGGHIAIDVYKRTRIFFPWHTTHFIRPITKRMKPQTLYNLIRKSVPTLIPMKRFIRRFGKVGHVLSYYVPITDYKGELDLSDEELEEWAILDTFDGLGAWHIKQKTPAMVQAWFEEAGLEQVWVGYGPNGVNGRGVRPK